MRTYIPLSVPNLKGNEIEYVTRAIQTEWVSTGGSFIQDFERQLAAYVGAKGAVACQNGTAGLHLSLIVAGVQAGDEVLVPVLTFIAAVNPVKYIGAEPVFMDCDDSLGMDPEKVEQFCRTECCFDGIRLINKKTGQPVKALMVVHVFGNMADMEKLMDIAAAYNLKVIEDATEALGTYYTQGKYAGQYAGTIGDLGVYSFNGNKIIITGGGGMIVANDHKLLDRAKHLSTQAKHDELHYLHDEIGYNYRMTNLQAALGLAQLEQIESFIRIKGDNYFLYRKKIKTVAGLNLLPFRESIRTNYWFYSLFIEDTFPRDRDALMKHFAEHNIQTRPIWGLINRQKPYRTNQAYTIEKAETYWRKVINIPCSSNLKPEEVGYVIDILKQAAVEGV